MNRWLRRLIVGCCLMTLPFACVGCSRGGGAPVAPTKKIVEPAGAAPRPKEAPSPVARKEGKLPKEWRK